MTWQPYEAYKPIPVEWLEEVPQHWTAKRLKYAASLNDEALPESTDPTYEFPYVDIGNVEAVNGIVGSEHVVFEDAPSRARRIARPGDTIVSTVRTYLRAIAPVRDADGELVVSTGFAVVRPRDVDPEYLSYALRETRFVEAIVSRSFGVSYPAINTRDVAGIEVPLPPPNEQRTIARFLDIETGKLDKLIAKKLTLIERLQEERASLITRTVTRGLPSEAATAARLNAVAATRVTGIEWMPEVPAHWEVKRLKYVAADVTVGVVVMPSQYYADEGVPALRSLNVQEMTLTMNNLVYFDEASNQILAKSMLRKGDLVVVRTGKPGTTAVVDERFEGANCIDLILIRKSPLFSSRFLGYVLNSGAAKAQYAAGAEGAIQQHFNVETADNLIVPLPPLSEQQAIEKFLDEEVGSIEALITKVEAAIDRLKEFRAALITAAVSGKIDVRGAAS